MKILIADIDPTTRWVLRRALREHSTVEVTSLEEIEIVLKNEVVQVVITTLSFPDGSVLPLIEKFKNISFIILTTNPLLERVSEALKKGAIGYLRKPINIEELSKLLESAQAERDVGKANNRLILHNIQVLRAFKLIKRSIEEGGPFLIKGEEGVGKKTLLFSALSEAGKRFIRMKSEKDWENYKTSVENEGLFVVFEDVEEFSLSHQKEIAEKAEKGELSFNLAFISKYDPLELFSEGKLTEKLFSLMNRRIIEIPPLRERKEEIPLFVEKIKAEIKAQEKAVPEISEEAKNALLNYSWPANIKELREKLKFIFSLRKPIIRKEDLPIEITSTNGGKLLFLEPLRRDVKKLLGKDKNLYNTIHNLVERVILEEALAYTNGNQLKAAELIGLHRNTIRNKIKKFFGGDRHGYKRRG